MSIASLMGSCRLNGCDDCRFVPNTSWLFMEPVMVTLSGDNGVSHGDGPIVAAQAQVAVGAQYRLLAFLVIGGAGVELVGRLGLRLVPERLASRQARVRSVAVGARSWARAGNRRLAAGREIVRADHVAGDLRPQNDSRTATATEQASHSLNFTVRLPLPASAVRRSGRPALGD